MAGMRNRLAALILAATAAVTVVGCSFRGDSAADKAGGSREPLVLRLANTNGQLDFTPTVVAFVDRVEELSGGDLRIEPVNDWGDSASGAEQQVVKDVAAGEIDLGWVGTRVFDTLDVKSFQALTAPMLIDSYALESAVIESGITEQMMRGLDGLGVAGLGVLPDGLRRPTGVIGPDRLPGGLAGDHVRDLELERAGRGDPGARGHAWTQPTGTSVRSGSRTGRSRDSRRASGSTSTTRR